VLDRYDLRIAVRDPLTARQALPRHAEVLAFETGVNDGRKLTLATVEN
jgi:hypothetical protein